MKYYQPTREVGRALKDVNVIAGGVDEFILKLSKPKYYRDPVVRSGYVRGSEPYNYVNDIFYRFKHYKDFVDE